MPPASERRPILVTGSHRSGTTWVGKMLAAGNQVAYISEPLNVQHRLGVLRARVSRWYTYICDDNQDEYLLAFLELLRYRYHLWAELRSLRSMKDLLRMGRDLSHVMSARIYRQRPLLKDPFAVFSAPWFADQLGCQVIVTIRHPAAFASSLKRLNWDFDLRDLLEQPLLMRDWLEPFHLEMEALAADDLIGQASLLWKMIYYVVDRYQKKYPEFRVVRHEDLSLAPLESYRELYQTLGLVFTPVAEEAIRMASSAQNPREASRSKAHTVKLDSRANLDNWKQRLSAGEIVRIRRATEEVASLYYSDSEWS
jgi:hypothetical protein